MTKDDDAQEAANPCRRRILTGLAAMVASANLPRRAHAAAVISHDATILFLRCRFNSAASAMQRTAGRRQAILFRAMSAHAAAMATIPASFPCGINAKREVAAWSFVENEQTLTLPAALVHDLAASALRDEARLPSG